MPRRFTDTEKWKDEWWGSLSNDYRMIWLYLVDSCSISGIWKKDIRGMNFNCNTNVTEEQLKNICRDRLIDFGNFFFMPKFLRFQCPKGLNSNKPAVLSIVSELTQNKLIETVHESLGNDFLIIKGKGTGTGKEKDKGTGKEKDKERERWTKEILADEIFLEELKMTHPGKDIKKAWGQCYMHHSNAPNPPDVLWIWKQKLNTWLTINKNEPAKRTSSATPPLTFGNYDGGKL